MQRPQTVLIILIALGLGLSGFFYGAHQTSTLAKQHEKALVKATKDLRAEIDKLKADSTPPPARPT